jgi:hypothetical protein
MEHFALKESVDKTCKGQEGMVRGLEAVQHVSQRLQYFGTVTTEHIHL